MMNKFILAAVLVFGAAQIVGADPTPGIGSVWGHAGNAATVSTAGQSSLTSDPLAHSVGDLLTIVVDLQNTITKAQNTTTAKTTAVDGTISALVYPTDATNHGWNFYNYHGQNPTTSWNSAQTFNGGGTIANSEATSTTIQARVIGVASNGVLRIEATRLSKAGDEDTSMILTGLVRPEDLSTTNTISSSNVADLEILQKGKGTITNNQRKGWLTKFYEFIDLFNLRDLHRLIASILLILLGLLAVSVLASAQTRIKDVATVEGARDNQLIGYGIVAGLDGQGDSDKLFTQQTISNMARRFGIQIQPTDITNKNVAIVMVTATIPPFTRQGTRLNATVASLADAKSLQGGVLMQTPLVAGDGQVYAVAQGSVFLGGFDAGTGGAGGASVTKNHTTSGVVTDGALVENEIPTTVFSKGVLEIVLRQGDFTSAVRMANAINDQIAHIAEAISPTTVDVYVPKEMQSPERQMEFVARIENASFVPDVSARIVINERTGTVVANANIQISKVAVAYGNLTVSVTSTPEVSQPEGYTDNSINFGGPGGNGGRDGGGGGERGGDGGRGGNAGGNNGIQTEVVNRTTTNVQEEKRAIVVLNDMPTVEDVAFALNSMGATPRELMSILQSIKDAGSLNAELVLE